MGWMRQLGRTKVATLPVHDDFSGKATVSHIEHAQPIDTGALKKTKPKTYTISADEYETGRSDLAVGTAAPLPYIPSDEVAKHDNAVDGFCSCNSRKLKKYAHRTGIVIDDKVYDVTNFIDVHPGGSSFFSDFGGKSCTWQFWRFHQAKHLSMWSSVLLIGKTSPTIPNPFPERPRWIKTS